MTMRRPPRFTAPLVLVVAMLALCGCSGRKGLSTRSSPYAPQSESARDPSTAERLTLEAADLIDSDPEKAERLLREALTADLMYGPAHNDLGVVHLKRGEWYSAASEFEWARKLMPGHPDPRMNLALTLERAGRTDEALATYQTALDVYPGHIPTLQALARLQIRSGRSDNRTREHLSVIALEGETNQWRVWARERLALDPNANTMPPESSVPGSP